MFDFHRCADSSREQAAALRQQGFEAVFTFTSDSMASSNPAFFIDVDTENNVSRMIVWASGDCDVTVLWTGSTEAQPLPDMLRKVTDDTFEGAFGRFVQHATS